jgi:subtilisin family serine protease
MPRCCPFVRLTSVVLLAAALSIVPGVSPADDFVKRVPLAATEPESVIPDQFVVEFKRDVAHGLEIASEHGRPRANLPSVQRALDRVGAVHAEREFLGARPQELGSRFHDLTGYYVVNIPPGADLQAAMASMASERDVDHVEPIGVHQVDLTPNDTYYAFGTTTFPNDEWHLWDLYGIDADMAWNTETGSPSVLVGMLDTGIKYRHTDLGGANPPGPADNVTQGSIWVNPGEIPGNSLDDDGNGYVDDVIGYDFVGTTPPLAAGYSCTDNDCGGLDNDPNDGNGHGTHTAGTVGAITNNARGVAGIAGGFSDGTLTGAGNGVKLVPCRIGVTATKGATVNGFVSMTAAAAAMNYLSNLVDAGFNVVAINCSWGSSNSGGLGAAADNLIAHDVMIVTSAGNTPGAPASYLASRSDVMAVAATDSTGKEASFTNSGTFVDVAAPGVSVLSTWHVITDPDTTHMYVALSDGTSMSAPHVVGVAALLESYNPALTRADKTSLIVNNTGPFGPTHNPSVLMGNGILNAQLALAAAPAPTSVPAFLGPRAGTLALAASPNPARVGSDLAVRAQPGERVRVAVVDAAGRHVRSFEGVASSTGSLRLRWDGRDAGGRPVGMGLYMVQASAGHERAATKLVVLE